jgi:hypothetical protein
MYLVHAFVDNETPIECRRRLWRERYRKYRESPEFMEKKRSRERDFHFRNKEKRNKESLVYMKENARSRELKKLNRIPKWVDREEKKRIRSMYLFRDLLNFLCKDKYEVDHIIPLNGKTVSGLHVYSNLQILLEKDNRSKLNTYSCC